MDQDATWCGGRPGPRRHCVRRVPSSPTERAQQAHTFWPMSISAHVCSRSYTVPALHITELFGVIHWTRIHGIYVADETQLYVPYSSYCSTACRNRKFTRCTTRVREKMASNEDEREDTSHLVSTRQQFVRITRQTLTMSKAAIQFSGVVNDLGFLTVNLPWLIKLLHLVGLASFIYVSYGQSDKL